jgi:hypothetical protein
MKGPLYLPKYAQHQDSSLIPAKKQRVSARIVEKPAPPMPRGNSLDNGFSRAQICAHEFHIFPSRHQLAHPGGRLLLRRRPQVL